jgi:hypothetical protein
MKAIMKRWRHECLPNSGTDPFIYRPLTIDTLIAQPSARLIGQLINALGVACLLDDGVVVSTWAANLWQMRTDQHVSLSEHVCHVGQTQLS